MAVIVAHPGEVVPLSLQVSRGGAAASGLTGALAPTVRLRDARTRDRYLDFSDFTFRTSGWLAPELALLPAASAGYYQTNLDLALVVGLEQALYVAEFRVEGSIDHDVLVVSRGLSAELAAIAADTSLTRKAITNRQEEYAGTPGRIIMFDDDGVTKLVEQELRDGAGDGIAAAVGVPSRRSGNIL